MTSPLNDIRRRKKESNVDDNPSQRHSDQKKESNVDDKPSQRHSGQKKKQMSPIPYTAVRNQS